MKKVFGALFKVLAVILIILLGYISYAYYMKNEKLNSIEGRYVRSVDLADESAGSATDYLSGIIGADISYDEVKNAMGDVSVDVFLTVTEENKESGLLSISVSEDKYNEVYENTLSVLEDMFKDIILKRLSDAGFDEYNKDNLDPLISDSLGMPLREYLRSYGPKLIPTLDELKDLYDREETYEKTEGVLTVKDKDRIVTEYYSRSGEYLFIYEDGNGSEAKTYKQINKPDDGNMPYSFTGLFK